MAAIDTQLITRELPQLIGREVSHMSIIMRREVDHRAIETLFVGKHPKLVFALVVLTLLPSVSPHVYIRRRWLDVLDDEAEVVDEHEGDTNHFTSYCISQPRQEDTAIRAPRDSPETKAMHLSIHKGRVHRRPQACRHIGIIGSRRSFMELVRHQMSDGHLVICSTWLTRSRIVIHTKSPAAIRGNVNQLIESKPPNRNSLVHTAVPKMPYYLGLGNYSTIET